MCERPSSFSLPEYRIVFRSTSHQRSFPNPWQRVWCVNIETGSRRTQTIPYVSLKDVTSRNQTQEPPKRRGRMQRRIKWTRSPGQSFDRESP